MCSLHRFGANFFYSNDPENWDKFDRFAQQTINGSKKLNRLARVDAKVPADEIAQHTPRRWKKVPVLQTVHRPLEIEAFGYVLDGESILLPIFIPTPKQTTKFLAFTHLVSDLSSS